MITISFNEASFSTQYTQEELEALRVFSFTQLPEKPMTEYVAQVGTVLAKNHANAILATALNEVQYNEYIVLRFDEFHKEFTISADSTDTEAVICSCSTLAANLFDTCCVYRESFLSSFISFLTDMFGVPELKPASENIFDIISNSEETHCYSIKEWEFNIVQ